ncbi:unnamed protein product [Echinostoma caproni]|uniref:DUF5727 domain-containing protein n=1 Tax=Echinostoma caproni TaxID=27848 RepID=A0A183AAZ2_9TREM|nr:unnamed protein product [Echinostoma caproni]
MNSSETIAVHHIIWIKAATIFSYGNELPLNDTQPYRLTEVLTGSFHFVEKWELLADVEFHEQFDFPNNAHVKTVTITMEVFCSVNPHISKASNNLFFSTTNVVLYATRNPCKPYNTLKGRGVPMLPNDMVLFNRSYLYVDDKLIFGYLWEPSHQWSKYAMK